MAKKKESAADERISLADLNQKYASDIVNVADDDNIDVIPSGSIVLDSLTGIGGYPRGRVTEVWGAEGVSKTTLALHASRECQKKGLAVVYFDFEGAFSNRYATSLGVDIYDRTKFIKFEFRYFEEARDKMLQYAYADGVGLLVLDSISAMTPKEHFEGKASIGMMARNLSQFFSPFVKNLRASRAACIAVNQIRTKVNTSGFGPSSTDYSPGGHALQFYNSIKIQLKAKTKVKGKVTDPLTKEKKDEFIKVEVQAKTSKNKFAKPFREGRYWVYYGKGVDNASSVYDIAKKRGLFTGKGWIRFQFPWEGKEPGEFKLQGEENVKAMLAADEDFLMKVLSHMDLEELYGNKDDDGEVIYTEGEEFAEGEDDDAETLIVTEDEDGNWIEEKDDSGLEEDIIEI